MGATTVRLRSVRSRMVRGEKSWDMGEKKLLLLKGRLYVAACAFIGK
jgi:hypothetical protein